MKLEMIFMIGNLKQDKEDAQKLLAWVKIINWLDNAILGIQGLPPLSGLLDKTIAEEELFASLPPRPSCPICCLPMSVSHTYQSCCGKNICDVCMYAV